MKKSLSFLVSAAMLFTAVSCSSDKKKNSSDIITTKTAQMLLRSADIEMAQDFSNILTIDSSSDSVLIFGELKSGEWCGYVTDHTFGEHTDFYFTPDDDEIILAAAMLPNMKKAVLSLVDDTARITVFNRDNLKLPIIECEGIIDSSTAYVRILGDGSDGFIIFADDCLCAISSDGTYRGDISTEGMDVYSIASNAEGGVTCLLADRNEKYLAEISPELLSITNKRSCGSMSSSALTMCAGMGEYELAGVFYDGLYGFKDGSWTMLCDFMDNSFSAYDVTGLVMTKENEFAALINKMGKVQLCLLTERDISEIKAKKTVKIATVNASDIGELVKRYNLSHEEGEYRIEVVDYNMNHNQSEGFANLKRDILSGNAPDILEFTAYMPINTFGAKESMFVDLYTLLDKDPDLSRKDLLPNILEGLESGGKLLQISPTFTFSTITARPDYAGIKENWSVSDMIEAYKNLPEGAYMFPDPDSTPRIAFYNSIVNESFFVDYDKAECCFDSPEYIGLLNFLIDNNIGRPVSELNDTGYVTDFSQTGTDVIDLIANFHSFLSLHSTVKGQYNGDVVFAGRPFDGKRNGSGISVGYCYGIMANSENIDGAWDFIKTFFSDYYYEELHGYQFPVLMDKFNRQADKTTRDYTYTDPETGETVTEKWTYLADISTGKKIEIDNFTPEECEYYKNIILSADVIEYDSTIGNICFEEVNKLFEGEYTAEDCAKMIQNRVSLYLSEHYQ